MTAASPLLCSVADHRIAISAPDRLRRCIARHIEPTETTAGAEESDCSILCEVARETHAIRRKRGLPFAHVEEVAQASGRAVRNYYRYDRLVRTLAMTSPTSYSVMSFVDGDDQGALMCLRDYVYRRLSTMGLLVHGSLVVLPCGGVLIVGPSGSGKTSLSVRLLSDEGAAFVSDESTLLQMKDGTLWGTYVPRGVSVRMATIAASGLRLLLDDLTLVDATQHFDWEAISEVVKRRAFDRDVSIVISRQLFAGLLGVPSCKSAPITRLVFPTYSRSEPCTRPIGSGEALLRIQQELKCKKEYLNLGELTVDDRTIDPGWLGTVPATEITFDAAHDVAAASLGRVLG